MRGHTHDDAKSPFRNCENAPKKILPHQFTTFFHLSQRPHEFTADTAMRSNTVHIRLSCEWLIKQVFLFFCRYETVHDNGASGDCDTASEYYVGLIMLGENKPDLPSVYNERYHSGKQICQLVILNTKPSGTFNATCGQ
jgi:hypothetical protein